MQLVDKQERLRALQVDESFIIQAPAGSGKTELLIQRFLKLLLVVEKAPEECLAITFTRKAAQEMRHRILSALSRATDDNEPGSEHEKATWLIAREVLARDAELGWDLFNNPSRLNIQTVDALCGRLTRMMPVTSKFGAVTNIAEDSLALYQKAALGLIQTAQTTATLTQPFSTLLLHLDNRLDVIQELLATMLMSREQWLGHIIAHQQLDNLKEHLESGLQQLSLNLLEALSAQQPRSDAIPQLARYAATNIVAMGESHSITQCEYVDEWPGIGLDALPRWQAIADWVLTKTGDVRKTVTKAQGFYTTPDASLPYDKEALKEHKAWMVNELNHLRENSSFVELLNKVRRIPPIVYPDKQWDMLEALFSLLPQLVAELHFVFSTEKVVDYTEIALAADAALGEFEQPSDLALALDYQIRHILVDEFQDTSLVQYRLLKKLTQGWELNDNRTLFLVGDPQQSIYRFRQADVSLYLTVKEYGINEIILTPLLLQANFRSKPLLVEKFNTLFKASFPKEAYAESGAVPFSPATPMLPESSTAQFKLFAKTLAKPCEEAQKIVETIQAVKENNKDASIAILVRARGHLKSILPALSEAGIAYRGVDIELLANKAVVKDLFCLTKALLHLNDRISWFSLLRAPYIGLTLNDCYHLADQTEYPDLWTAMQQASIQDKLSKQGRLAILSLLPLMKKAFFQLGTLPIMDIIAELWHGLEGQHCYTEGSIEQDAKSYLTLLSTIENEQLLYQEGYLEKKLDGLFAEPKPQTDEMPVEIMTIHRSKGLEFDVVLLPGLDKASSRPDEKLLAWDTVTNQFGQEQLIFAPMKSATETSDFIYQYLQDIEKERDYHESVRLFYVATTRAKEQLYLFGYMTGEKPKKQSFLNLVWQIPSFIRDDAVIEEGEKEEISDNESMPSKPLLRRTQSPTFSEVAWVNPHSHYHQNLLNKKAWQAGVGEAIHRLFWAISLKGISQNLTCRKTQESHWIQLLKRYQVPEAHLVESLDIIETCLKQTLNCEKGRWILNSSLHESPKSEWALTISNQAKVKKLIIDRTFISDNIRWVIDYKVVFSEIFDVPTLKEKHQQQLQSYITVLKEMEPNRTVKAALYCPLQAKLIEVT